MNDVVQVSSDSLVESTVSMKVVNRVAVIKLNRPKSLNALSHEMVLLLSAAFRRCRLDDGIVAVVIAGAGEKAFCAGGDVREIYERARSRDRVWLQFFVDEYRLDYAIHRFPKPVVALLDGVTMGGGMGLGQGAWLRVVTERTKMAMPETRIGLVPDVGASHFMTKMPAEFQLYLTLTGAVINGAEAMFCNLADVCVSSASLSDFEARLNAITPSKLDLNFPDQLKQTLRKVFDSPEPEAPAAPLRLMAPLINRYFQPRSKLEEIFQTLKDDCKHCSNQDARSWIEKTLAVLEQQSPTMSHVAREAVHLARHSSLAECFRLELGIVSRAIEDGDFLEGVRAHLVDKDMKPRWAPQKVWEVRSERVQHFLSSPWSVKSHPLRDIEILHP